MVNSRRNSSDTSHQITATKTDDNNELNEDYIPNDSSLPLNYAIKEGLERSADVEGPALYLDVDVTSLHNKFVKHCTQ